MLGAPVSSESVRKKLLCALACHLCFAAGPWRPLARGSITPSPASRARDTLPVSIRLQIPPFGKNANHPGLGAYH